MKLTNETKFFIGIIGVSLLILTVAVILFSQPPKPIDRAVLIPPDATATGSAQAKVNLVEFSDYQCPSCKLFAPVVKELTDKYKDKLYFVYRDYPLPQHEFARSAAQAAHAAELQGKFWEMHDLLFRYQDDLSPAKLVDYANLLKLDINKFNLDSTSSAISSKIEKSLTDGNNIKISETPTFFLNGVKMTILSQDEFKKTIEQAIKEAK
jgi:protein-disulfide isomerase